MSEFAPDRPPRRLPRIIVALAIVVILVVLFRGCAVRPADPPRVAALSTNTGSFDKEPRRAFRIAVFNIQGGRGIDDRIDLARTARLLGSFDVIGLNEVRGFLFADPSNQAETLGLVLDAPWMFAPSERRWWHDHFGNGLVSRINVSRAVIWPMRGTTSDGWRNLVHARLKLDDREDGGAVVNLLLTHVDRVVDRAEQFHSVAQMFLSMSEPAILMGDLNTRANEPMMQQLLATAGVHDPIGDTGTLPASERVDWILTRGLQTLEGGAVTTLVSDHPLVWAHLALPDQGIERLPATQPTTKPGPSGPERN